MFGLFEIGFQLVTQQRVVFEGILFRVFFHEKVKRIDHRHFGVEPYVDHELVHRFGENHPRDLIAERILLPMNLMIGGLDLHLIVMNWRSCMWRRVQPNDMRRHSDRTVIDITRVMFDTNVYCHGEADSVGSSKRLDGRFFDLS